MLSRQALDVVRLRLTRSVAFNVKETTTTTELMQTLSHMYEKPSTINQVYLMCRMFNLKMVDGSSTAEHINEVNSIISQLSLVDINFEDEVRALILMSSLPKSWKTMFPLLATLRGRGSWYVAM